MREEATPPPAVRHRWRAGWNGRRCTLEDADCGFAGIEGRCRGATRWRRVHPSVCARVGVVGFILVAHHWISLVVRDGRRERGRGMRARVTQPSIGSVLFGHDLRRAVGSKWTAANKWTDVVTHFSCLDLPAQAHNTA
jgi:hypothetical protein